MSELTEDEILQKAAKDLCRNDGKAWSLDHLQNRVPGVTTVSLIADDNDRTEYLNSAKALLA
jgi:hypothetical protein